MEGDDQLFMNRKSQRDLFENTAPMKMFNNDDRNGEFSSKDLRQDMTAGASAPQENRKSKKTLIITRNHDPSDFSLKESIESAQFINFNNRVANNNKKLDDHAKLMMMRASHVSNGTHLRVESIMEGGASVGGGSSVSPSPYPYHEDRNNALSLNPTPNLMGNSNFL